MSGVALMLRHATIAMRDCKLCLQYLYDDRTGERSQWRGRDAKRPAGSAPPCVHNRCKKIGPDAFRTLLPHNTMAYQHYLECRATGHFPDDPIVKRNARVIRTVEDEIAKIDRLEEVSLQSLGTLSGPPIRTGS